MNSQKCIMSEVWFITQEGKKEKKERKYYANFSEGVIKETSFYVPSREAGPGTPGSGYFPH